MITSIICSHCQLPLVQFDITLDWKTATKTYRHNHCGKIVKKVTVEIKKEMKPCPGCKEPCATETIEEDYSIFNCDKCGDTGFGRLSDYGRGGGGGYSR